MSTVRVARIRSCWAARSRCSLALTALALADSAATRSPPRRTLPAMFLGHFAVALGAKRVAPRASLGTLVMASQLIDLAWPALVLAGVEVVRVDPGNTAYTPLDFVSYPFTHGGASVLLWAAAINDKELRRLQLAAEAGKTLGFIYRPQAAALSHSPAALRLCLHPAERSLCIEIKKCRGGYAGGIVRCAIEKDHAADTPSPQVA